MNINKSTGLNDSEHRLVKIGERVFMGLWSYPNPKIDTTPSPKELCDLLVVCGDNVLIFSDKHIEFNKNTDLLTAWKRWERKAILESIRQLRHAENIIRDHPEKILLNDKDKFPLSIPSKDKIKIHLICIANGIKAACAAHYGKNCTGSLQFSNLGEVKELSRQELINLSEKERESYIGLQIFKMRDYDRENTFVHVFDDFSFPFVLSELDTLTDFVNYLSEKELFIRSKSVIYTGEEDILLHYISNIDEKRKCHTFLASKDSEIDGVMFSEEDWDSFRKRPQYIAKQEANSISYFWDQLVQKNAFCTLNGITQKIFSSKPCDCDIALRYMALEDRFARRFFSNRLLASIKNFPDNPMPKHYMSAFFSVATNGLMYIFLQTPRNNNETHDEYLKNRRKDLEIYANCAKAKCESEKKVVNKFIGIATEPIRLNEDVTTDIMLTEFSDWPAKEQEYWEESRKKLNIFRTNFDDLPRSNDKEWPDIKLNNKNIKVGPNEKCLCGSGKKYKKCCGSVLIKNMN